MQTKSTSIGPVPIPPPEIEENVRSTGASRVLAHAHYVAQQAGEVRMMLESRTKLIMRQGPRKDLGCDGVPEPGSDAPLFAELLEALNSIQMQVEAIYQITENMDI